MKPNQVRIVAPAVPGDAEQFVHALEAGFTRQIVGHIVEGHGLDRIHHDVALVHPVAPADLDVGPRPDANAAADPAAPDAVAKVRGERHALWSAAVDPTERPADRSDGIPVAGGGRHATEPVERAEVADDFHVPPVEAKYESILPRDNLQQPCSA